MSNVTPDEIVDLTAREFKIQKVEMKGRWFGSWGRGTCPPALTARKVATLLIQRHTEERTGATLARFCLSASNPGRIRLDAIDIETRLATDADLRAAIDGIERRIDELHETRVAKLDDEPRRRVTAHA